MGDGAVTQSMHLPSADGNRPDRTDELREIWESLLPQFGDGRRGCTDLPQPRFPLISARHCRDASPNPNLYLLSHSCPAGAVCVVPSGGRSMGRGFLGSWRRTAGGTTPAEGVIGTDVAS